MTKLEDGVLSLDLENDQVARDSAFTYAMNIVKDKPELSTEILKTIEENEQ